MSRELIVIKRCDMDKTVEADETIEISFDGVEYEIDLSEQWAAKLRSELRPYLEAAFSKKRTKAPTGTRAVKAENRRIRTWARDRGYEISDKGIIPEGIRTVYTEEQTLLAKATARQAKPKPAPVAPAAGSDRGHTTGGDTARALAVADPDERRAMRAWAAKRGRKLGRGLIPSDVQQAYRAELEATA